MSPSRRPPLAIFVRLRQELTRRLDAIRDSGIHARDLDLTGRLTPGAAAAAASRDEDGLRHLLAERAAARFPLSHLIGRDPATLPSRDRVLDLAEASWRGDWTLFGKPVRVAPTGHEWTSHPVTGARTELRHWHHMQYMNGIDGGDVKFLWELNRHAGIVRLAQGYFLTREERFAERAVELLNAWITQNQPSRGINWTSSLEVAFRAIAWCWIWSLTCDYRGWSGARLTRFLSSLWHHARHVERYDSTHHSPNTHLTGEALGLVYVGVTFPELSRSTTWVKRGSAILAAELERQVFDDGMHFERSVGYHRYTAEFYLHWLLLGRHGAIRLPRQLEARLRAMVDVTSMTRCPDGSWPVIGDEDSGSTLLLSPGSAQDQGPLLAAGAGLLGESRWLEHLGDDARSGAWWLLDDASWHQLSSSRPPSEQRAPRIEAQALPTAGYYLAHEEPSADGWYCMVDAGPHGGDVTGHAHTDLGHVEVARGTWRCVVDPGCSGYTIDPARRDWFRSESAHGCLVIEGVPLAQPSGPFSWARVSPAPSVSHGATDAAWWCDLVYVRSGASGRLTHRRQVTLVAGWGIIVADWVTPSGPEAVSVHWPLADVSGELAAGSVRSGDGRVLWAIGTGAELDTAALDRTTASPGYAREVDARLLRLRYRCSADASVVTAFGRRGATLTVAAASSQAIRCDLGDAERGGAVATVTLRPGQPPAVELAPAASLTSPDRSIRR